MEYPKETLCIACEWLYIHFLSDDMALLSPQLVAVWKELATQMNNVLNSVL